MNIISIHADYQLALGEIKQRIQATQMRAMLAANYELLSLYWYIGQKIVTLQQAQGWGSAVVEQMAADLQADHPGIQEFSRTSLFAMRQFYLFLSPRFEVVPQPVGQLPWGISARFLVKSRRSILPCFTRLHAQIMAGAVRFWICKSNKACTCDKDLRQWQYPRVEMLALERKGR